MQLTDLKPGDKVWYMFRIPGLNLSKQSASVVVKVGKAKVQILCEEDKRSRWVRPENLRPTN